MSPTPLAQVAAPALTSVLSDEHRTIEVVLLVLERMADEAFGRARIDVDDARRAISFVREFADRLHHGKEEARLFPAMEACGLPADAGPTAVMRAEHDIGRAHVHQMDLAVADFEKGVANAADRFAFEARGFVDMLRDHIAKEDQVLFPMAERMIPGGAQADLLAEFRRFDAHDVPAGTRERFLAVAADLAAKYGVTPEQARACGSVCGCRPVDR